FFVWKLSIYDLGPDHQRRWPEPGVDAVGRRGRAEQLGERVHEKPVDDFKVSRASETRVVMKDLFNVQNMVHIAQVQHL
ncbi:hypothetical protein TorRG33x02_315990, partial [Trema orientale]